MSLFSNSGQGHAEILRKQLRKEGRRILRIELELCGRPRKAILDQLALNESQLSRILSDDADASFPSDLVPIWTEAIGPRYAEWLRLQTPDTPSQATTEDPLVLVGLLAKAVGDNTQAMTADIAMDGRMDDRQAHLAGLFKVRAYADSLIAIAQSDPAASSRRPA